MVLSSVTMGSLHEPVPSGCISALSASSFLEGTVKRWAGLTTGWEPLRSSHLQ